MEYASIIHRQRLKTGLSQEELASRIGTSETRIQKWEAGETLPNLMQVPLLCAALHLSYDDFFSLQGKTKRRQHRKNQTLPMYQISYFPVMCNVTMQYYRRLRKLSVQDFAERCSVSETLVQKWEAGKSIPKLDIIPVICSHGNHRYLISILL